MFYEFYDLNDFLGFLLHTSKEIPEKSKKLLYVKFFLQFTQPFVWKIGTRRLSRHFTLLLWSHNLSFYAIWWSLTTPNGLNSVSTFENHKKNLQILRQLNFPACSLVGVAFYVISKHFTCYSRRLHAVLLCYACRLHAAHIEVTGFEKSHETTTRKLKMVRFCLRKIRRVFYKLKTVNSRTKHREPAVWLHSLPLRLTMSKARQNSRKKCHTGFGTLLPNP